MSKKQFGTRLDPSLFDHAKAAAAKRHVPLCHLVETALIRELSDEVMQLERPAQVRVPPAAPAQVRVGLRPTKQLAVRIDWGLAARARAAASQRSVSLAALVSAGLKRELGDDAETAESLLAALVKVRTEAAAIVATVDRLAEAGSVQSPADTAPAGEDAAENEPPPPPAPEPEAVPRQPWWSRLLREQGP